MVTLRDAEQSLQWCDSFARLPALIELAWKMNERDWLTLLGGEWSGCDNIGVYLDELMETPFGWRLGRGIIAEMMDANELEALDKLPNEFVVYRGCYKNNKWGLSWTTSPEIARSFPTLHRYQQEGQPLLVKAMAKKAEVMALKMERNESEIIIHRPRHISTSHIRVA